MSMGVLPLFKKEEGKQILQELDKAKLKKEIFKDSGKELKEQLDQISAKAPKLTGKDGMLKLDPNNPQHKEWYKQASEEPLEDDYTWLTRKLLESEEVKDENN